MPRRFRDVLARGPFSSRDDAMAEIERIKVLDEFKGVTLTAVRVDILSEESVAPAPPANSSARGPVSIVPPANPGAPPPDTK